MAISDVALAQTLTDQLSTQQDNVANLEEQLSTGQVLNRPSDDPAAVAVRSRPSRTASSHSTPTFTYAE